MVRSNRQSDTTDILNVNSVVISFSVVRRCMYKIYIPDEIIVISNTRDGYEKNASVCVFTVRAEGKGCNHANCIFYIFPFSVPCY